jgi:feruloyl esterase
MNKIWYGMTADGSVPDPAIDNGFDSPQAGTRVSYGFPRGGRVPSMFADGWGGGLNVGYDMLGIVLGPKFGSPPTTPPGFAGLHNATGDGQDGWKDLSYAQFAAAFLKAVSLNPELGYDANNPDLTRLKSAGTKLLHQTSWADQGVWVQGHTDYYDRVLERMGGLAAVQDYYKLYVLPGLAHGNGNGSAVRESNPPSIAPYQTLHALFDWVEKGTSPDTMVFTAHSGPATAPDMSLPACAYPKKPTYLSGDIRNAASYGCQ